MNFEYASTGGTCIWCGMDLCATIHPRGDQGLLHLPLPSVLQIRLRHVTALGSTLAMLFDKARSTASGQTLVLDRLCDILLIRLLRHASDSQLVSTGQLSGLTDGALSRARMDR